MARMEEILLRLPVELQTRLRDQALRDGISQAELIRRALTSYISTTERTARMPTPESPILALIGTNVLVRTVTFYYTGRVKETSTDQFLVLDDAAWIADTGRFATALTTGTLSEVEPYPTGCIVNMGAVIDITAWAHRLPRTQK